jgi:riboflavin synthase
VFTGLVTAVGRLQKRAPLPSGERLWFSHPYGPLALGESVAVSGACLTVVEDVPGEGALERVFAVDLSTETLRLTRLGELELTSRVNLERALLAEDRMGGHLVTGHVDGVGVVSARQELGGEMTQFSVRTARELGRYLARKGSITVLGVSLTVNDVQDLGEQTEFSFVVIPHTKSHTTLGDLGPGSAVTLEVDLIARYVERLLGTARSETPA